MHFEYSYDSAKPIFFCSCSSASCRIQTQGLSRYRIPERTVQEGNGDGKERTKEALALVEDHLSPG